MTADATTASTEAEPHSLLARLMDGYLSTQLLYVAAELGIADALAARPRTAGALSQELGVRSCPLSRVLRGLAADGVLEELPDGRFGLAPPGLLLRADTPDSQRDSVLARGGLYYRALGGLLDGLREGGTPFERAHGKSFFNYLGERPSEARAFQHSMAARSRYEAAAVVEAYDFSRFRRLVDVGGGRGELLAEVLAATPPLSGVLFDLPGVAEQARAYLDSVDLAGRWRVESGDFFDAVTVGGDAYLLSRVIHNWDDDAALCILQNCRRAMKKTSTLLLVEAVLPERAVDQPAAIRMDLHMLALLGGQERTASEFTALLAAAGFTLSRIVPTTPEAGINVIEARPILESMPRNGT